MALQDVSEKFLRKRCSQGSPIIQNFEFLPILRPKKEASALVVMYIFRFEYVLPEATVAQQSQL